MLRVIGVLAGSALSLALTGIPADAGYYPHVSGPPLGTADGVLVNLGAGMGSGDVTIRQAGNKRRSFYMAVPFLIDGKRLNCAITPTPHYSPPPSLCRYWPGYLKIGHTRVRVYYWRGTRWGKPTEITREIRVLRAEKKPH
jgi:hypothetical protein